MDLLPSLQLQVIALLEWLPLRHSRLSSNHCTEASWNGFPCIFAQDSSKRLRSDCYGEPKQAALMNLRTLNNRCSQ